MRLGFHYHIPFHRTATGEVTTPGYLGRFLDSLAEQVDELVCFMHSATAGSMEYSSYALSAPNIRWVDIGPWTSVPRRTLYARRFCAPLRKHADQLDAVLIRGPSPLLPAMANAAAPIPVALLLVGDYLAGIDDLPQPKWRKEAIRLWSRWNFHQQMRVAAHSLTFVNSRQLYEQMRSQVPDLIETRTTTLSEDDFYEREDTCQSHPIRLLYTGRMDRAKGLFEMVHALQILTEQGDDVVLDLVGWPAKGDTILEELFADAEQRGIRDRICYHASSQWGLSFSPITVRQTFTLSHPKARRVFHVRFGRRWRIAFRSLRRKSGQFRIFCRMTNMQRLLHHVM